MTQQKKWIFSSDFPSLHALCVFFKGGKIVYRYHQTVHELFNNLGMALADPSTHSDAVEFPIIMGLLGVCFSMPRFLPRK